MIDKSITIAIIILFVSTEYDNFMQYPIQVAYARSRIRVQGTFFALLTHRLIIFIGPCLRAHNACFECRTEKKFVKGRSLSTSAARH